ncbi:unnamed protein product [Candidula unifasciata]|uniref:Zinc finger protein n=1 Tax=Candidula unifasciata TaxID=100452 RepID=A0A8S3ZF69_9EUPU|nr:unnamed protein product [Candidula unifasciata]
MDKPDKDGAHPVRKEANVSEVTSIKRYKRIDPQQARDGADSHKCLVCTETANYLCTHCEVSQYCSLQHMRTDTIHPKVCDHLAFLNRKQELLPRKEDREQQLKQNKLQKLGLASKMKEMALQMRLEDADQQAKLACTYSYKIYSDILGPSSDSSLDVLVLYIVCCIKLHQCPEAEACVAEVKKHLSESTTSTFSVKADLEKIQGLLQVAKGNAMEALSHFTKEVYFAAYAYGKKHVLATGSLTRLGSSFLQMGKPSVADSLYRKAVEAWVQYLEKKVFEHETMEMQSRFVDVVHLKTEAMELKVKLEAKDTLTAIYKDRRFAKVQTMRNNMAMTCYANGMFAYVSERYIQAYHFVNEALLYCKKDSWVNLTVAVTNFYKLCKRKGARDVRSFLVMDSNP